MKEAKTATWKWITGALVVGLVVLLSLACAPTSEPAGEETAAEPVASEPAGPAPARLPVSLNDVMVALVNYAADPIWVAAWHNPETDAEWRELERRAYQLEIAGALLPIPGTGPLDEEWTSNPDWKKWADQLRATGADAVVAVEQRDLEAISKVGDRIVEVCEGCHFDFKLDMPTGGKFGELSPTAADLEDEGEQ